MRALASKALMLFLPPLVLAACSGSANKAPAPVRVEVGTVELKSGPVTHIAELPGRVTPYQTSDVRPQVGGVIIARLFDEGANVTAGQVLYEIEPAPYRAALAQAQAQLASAKAMVVTAKAKADRYAGLVKVNGVAKQDYDDALAAYGQAEAAVGQQTAAVESARINLAWTSIRAPISGRIGASNLTVGALVTPGQTTPLTTIQRLDPIYVDVSQPAVELLKLKKAIQSGEIAGSSASTVPVRLKLEDGSLYSLEGELQFTDVTVDQATDGVTLKAIFRNPRGILLPGLFVMAEVPQGTRASGLLAPEQGVSRDEKGLPTALVVGRGGRVEFRALETGGEIGNQWLILKGLAPGDHLIVEGLQRVKPGDVVIDHPVTLALVR
ncbi:MAG TPA: efflux RND transporter periplasmic adaptor subunit [Caulobacteraceae bacterium]